MAKPLPILLLVVALLAGGCGGDDEPVDTDDATGSPETTGTVADNGVSARLECVEPVTVGVVTDLTGGLSIYGTQLERSVAIGLAYASGSAVAAGPAQTYQVDDCEIRVVIGDDQSNPEVAELVARRLIAEEGAGVLIGSAGAGTTAALREVAADTDVILVATTDTPTGLTEADFHENVFLLALSQAQHAYATCGYFAAALGAQSFAQIAPDFPAGHRAAASYRAACESTGGDFVGPDRMLPTGTTDFSSTVAELAEDDPDALLLTWSGGGIGSLLTEVAEAFPADTAFGVTFAPDAVLPLFFDVAAGWTSPTTYHYTSPSTDANDYLVETLAAVGATPDHYDAMGMDAALLVVTALRVASDSSDVDALRTALEGVESAGPKGRLTVRPSDHLIIQDTYIVELLNTDDPSNQFFDTVATIRPEPPCLLEGEATARCS
jgi:branched-chain amino acid transport system substrate-binding protein